LRVRRDGFGWSSIVRDARALIADCRACVTNTVGKTPIAPATVFTNEKTVPNDVVHMDTMFFSHDADGTGESRAAVIIDRFSGYMAVYPLQAVNSECAADAMRDWIACFGAPTTVITDGGSEYQGSFEQLLSARSIEIVHGVPFNKSSNSIAEAAIKVLRGYARKISKGNFHGWVRDCKDAASAHNSRGSTFLSNTSPAEAFLGRRIDLNGRRPDIERHFADAEAQEAAERTKVLEALAEQAARRTTEYKDARTRDAEDRLVKIEKHLEQHGPPTKFEAGQLVVVKVPIKKYKMQPAYAWPPRVVSSVSKVGTITLLKTDRTGPDEDRKYRPHDLKMYTGTDPGAQFVVSDILAARWSRLWDDNDVELPLQVMYKVRWAGFKAQDDSWQLEADLPSSEHWKERMAALQATLPKTPVKGRARA
jgi:transposase InsO family protein